MTNYLLRTFLFGFLFVGYAHAGIKAYVDRDEVSTNETFTFVIELDQFTNESPDLSGMPTDILILGSSKYHRSSTVNGVSETQLGWKITLMIKEKGIYTIPSFTVDGQTTQPIQVTVNESTNSFSTDQNADAIMLEGELSKPSVYVQEQLLYTIKLYRSVQTQYASLTEPVVENALIEKVGEDTQYDSMINGRRYRILERTYAIFPQQSGELTIPKIVFSADVIAASNNNFGRLLGRTRPVTITTEQKTVSVKPYPDGHTGLWLPSKNVNIRGAWTTPGDKVVGEPSTWTITLSGVGLHENQLPDIELPNVSGLKWYPDNAEKNRKFTKEGVIGERIMRVAVVPSEAGQFTIPDIAVRWFNTETEQYETAVLSSPKVRVKANPDAAQLSQPITINEPIQPTTAGDIQVIHSNLWRNIAVVMTLLWLGTLVFALSRKPTVVTVTSGNSQTASPSLSPNSREKLQQAIKQGNRKLVYQRLAEWLNDIAKPMSFKDHLSRLTNEVIVDSLLQLEASLFSPEKPEWNDFEQLGQWLTEIQKQRLAPKPGGAKSPIPELYPE